MAGEDEKIRVIDSEIPGHWERATFRQLLQDGSLELVQDGNHGGAYPKPDEFETTGIPIITGADLNAGAIDLCGCKFLKPACAERLRIGFAKQGDVLLTHKGTMGKTAIVPPLSWPYIILNPQLTLYRVSRDGRLNGRFLKFFFDGKPFQAFLERISGISTISTLSLTVQKSLEIPLPPLDEQNAIAAVLGALDDKIELNRRMNATLEAMARALFQSWFADFDPVRAKMDGREPVGFDPDTAARIPDSFRDSEAGHIPRGWKVGRVAEIVEFSRSSVDPSGFPDEIFNHYSLPAFDEGRTPKPEPGSSIKSNKLVVTRDSVLLSKLNPHIQRIWLPDLHSTRRSVCSTEFIVATPRDGYSREFLFSLFTSGPFASAYCTLVTGTTGSHQRIHPGSVLDMKVVNPPVNIVEAFTAVTKPMFDQVNRNIDQSRTLATLRDTLLPKLLSGELSISAVPEIMEAVK